MRDALRVENGDDLVRARVDDEDLVADQDVVVTAPLGIDHEHLHLCVPNIRFSMDAENRRGKFAT